MMIIKQEQETRTFIMCLLQIGCNTESVIDFLVKNKNLDLKEAQAAVDDVMARLRSGERIGA